MKRFKLRAPDLDGVDEGDHEQELALQNRQLAALLRTSSFLIEGNDLSEQLGLIASTVRELSGFHTVKLFAVSEESQMMEMVVAVGQGPEGRTSRRQGSLPVQEVTRRLFREDYRISNSYLIHSVQSTPDGESYAGAASADTARELAGSGQWSDGDVLVIPMYLRDKRLVGMMCGSHPADRKMPTVEDVQFLEVFAGQAAIAIRNSHLYTHLQAAVKAKDEFLAIVSHELKTPLTSIMAYTQHLLRRLSPGEENSVARAHLDVVNAQSRRMIRLVQELLDVSSLEKGDLDLRKAVVDVGEVMQRSVSTATATSTKHRFVVERQTGPAKVLADASRIGQVIDDLVENAVKYSPEGGDIRVRLQVESGEVIVSISDQGVGIAKEHMPHIFERFYQADGNPRSRQFGGMGLGLYLSKQLVEAHGGRIWVESKKGEGSTVYFALPLHSTPPDDKI